MWITPWQIVGYSNVIDILPQHNSYINMWFVDVVLFTIISLDSNFDDASFVDTLQI
jgi:hypothetical protein